MSNLPGMAYRCKNDRDWTMEFINEGCLEDIWLFVEGVKTLKGTEKMGARHKAGANASMHQYSGKYLKSLVLSHKSGRITAFEQGRGIFSRDCSLQQGYDTQVLYKSRLADC